MQKKQVVITNNMTLKERVKLILICLFFIAVITESSLFFINVSGATIIDIFAGADTVYYSWRDVLALLFLPVMGYFDILALLSLFLPFTLHITRLWVDHLYILTVYSASAFLLTLPLSLYISFFPLSDYYMCSLRGPFSGIHYVKDLKMCEQFEYHPEKEKSGAASISIISEGKK